MATHASVLAWRIPGTGEPGGLPSMGSHRVRHDWSNLAAAGGYWNMAVVHFLGWINTFLCWLCNLHTALQAVYIYCSDIICTYINLNFSVLFFIDCDSCHLFNNFFSPSRHCLNFGVRFEGFILSSLNNTNVISCRSAGHKSDWGLMR